MKSYLTVVEYCQIGGAVVPLYKIEGECYTTYMQPSDNQIDKNKAYNKCLRCGISLADKKGWKYCGERCRKLYLKAQYKKRNRDKLREYNKGYRKQAIDAYFVRSDRERKMLFSRMPRCQKCSTDIGLQLCHIKPHWAGGTKELYNFIVLCRVCHSAFDTTMRKFWNAPVDTQTIEVYRAQINDDMLFA